MKKTALTLAEVLEIVAEFVEATYPESEYSTVLVSHGRDLPQTVLFVTPSEWRTSLRLSVLPSVS